MAVSERPALATGRPGPPRTAASPRPAALPAVGAPAPGSGAARRDACQPTIRLPQFEGAIELLLSLVERRRLPIMELSLAVVADQYLAYVRTATTLDRDTLSEFLVIAARLVLLKSRALLPRLAPADEADGELVDDLVGRLETYRVFKLIAEHLGDRERDAARAFARGLAGACRDAGQPAALAPISAGQLADLCGSARAARSAEPPDEPAEAARVGVAEQVLVVRLRLQEHGSIDWETVGRGSVDEVVATLLAVLELVRRGELRVEQADPFGPIRLHALDHPAVAGGRGARVRQA